MSTASSPYTFPFPGGATAGRVDQGVDYSGSGPIVAIGDAEILRIGAPGWPGGGGVLYRLTSGPLAGHSIYVYEGIRPTVRAGQSIRAGQQIGTFVPGSSTGIEMGFADASGVPLSHAGYHEGQATSSGQQMATLLHNLAIINKGGLHPITTAGAVAGAAGNIGLDLASKIVSAIFDAIAPEGARILLYLALVLGGGGLVAVGLGRMFGIGGRTPAHAAGGVK